MGSFNYRIPVRFSDVDHAGLVYHPVFFDYFHMALEELFRERVGPRGYVEMLDEDRIGLPAVRSECDFRLPVRFGDTIEIEMSVTKLGRSSVEFLYRVFLPVDGDLDQRSLAAEGSNVCVTVDLEAFRAVAIPDKLRRVFRDLQSKSREVVV